MITVIYLENGLNPHLRRVEQVPTATIRELAPEWQIAFVAFVAGKPVLRKDWDILVEEDSVLAFIEADAIPQGGGGGSSPLRTVLMIAVMVAAPYAATAMLGITGAAALGAVGVSMFTAGVAMVGMALVNAIAPPPKLPSTQQAAALAAASPTYSLQAQGNSARLEAAIPEHFGRMICYPDFAAQPYTEFAGNDQYLYQLLCIGRGEYDLEGFKIEDTAIENFNEVSYEIVRPGEVLDLFPSDVITSIEVSGQTMDGGVYVGPFVASGAGSTANYIGIDFIAPKGFFYATDTGSLAAMTAVAIVEARLVDSYGNPVGSWVALTDDTYYSPWSDWGVYKNVALQETVTGNDGKTYIVQNFPANTATEEYRPADFGEMFVGVLIKYKQSSVKVRTRTASYQVETFTAATNTPQRYSRRYPVAPGRYQVRVKRIDTEQTDSRYGHTLMWGGMRAYLKDDTRTFGDVTLVGMRLRATDNLSMQSSRKINVIATRKLPVWNGSAWSANTATRSPAWAIAYACKQVGLTDAQIDRAGLLTLATTCAARGDTFDGRFDSFLSFWEAVSKMAGAVRAKPFMQGGVMRVVRDQASTIPVALFSQRNIVKGSLSVNYLMPTDDTADSVDVGYFDDITWQSARVRSTLSGSTALKPAKVDLFGVVSRAQAHREGLYQAACNRFRRKIITFQTEMEGFIPSFGDLIAIQHDMPAWGQSGEVVGTSVNLLPGASTGVGWSGWYSANEFRATAAATGETTYIYSPRVHVNAGVKVTLRFESKQIGSIGSCDLFILPDTYASEGLVTTGYSLSTDWVQQQVSFTTPAGWVSNVRVRFDHNGGNGTSASVCVRNVKLEYGDAIGGYVPTGTTPAMGLILSEPPVFTTGTHYIALRKRDGSVDGPYACTPGLDPNQVNLSVVPATTPYTGMNEERTHYAFGTSTTWRQPARILSAKPQGLHLVTIEAINEDDSVHTADTGVTMPVQVFSQLAGFQNAPVVSDVSARFLFNYPNTATASWPPAPWADHYYVEVSIDGAGWVRVGDTTACSHQFTAPYGKSTIVRVAAVGLARGPWTQANVVVVPPFDPTGITYEQELSGVRIKWDERLEINFYELRVGGSNWESSDLVAPVTGTEYLWQAQATGSYTLRIKSIDVNGNYSTNAASATITVTSPGAPDVTYALSGPDEVLTWSIPVSGFTVDRYEVRLGANWAAGAFVDSTKATSLRRKVTYSGPRLYLVAAVDVAGNYGSADSVSVNIAAPGAVTGARTEVIDNNALIYWGAPATGSLPVDRYEARKGASWAAGAVIGSNGNSTFTTVFEQVGGVVQYWLSAVDSAGNVGPAVSVLANINQPPDYVLRSNIDSTFSGVKVSALPYDGGLLLPVNTTETWAQHFSANGYATPQAQITAGNPLYIEPGLTTATYTEYIDYGSALPATTITATLSSTVVAGSVAVACQIRYKLNSGDAWINATAGASALAVNFRYVQVVYTFTAAGGANLLQVNAINVKLSIKQRSDSGSAAVVTASTGVWVPFGYAFLDADLPQVQPAGAVPLIAVVDYTDTPNPTGFTVYLYTLAGVKTTGSFSWSVKGY